MYNNWQHFHDYTDTWHQSLSEIVKTIEHNFADDTNISVNVTNVDQISVKLNTEIQKIPTWLTANKLTLNATKTEFMIIGSKHNLILKFKRIQLLQLEIII
jgi:hypothetical protein